MNNSGVFGDYQEKVARFGHVLNRQENIAHAICGMLGEVGELREVSHLIMGGAPELSDIALVEELGDCWWYAAWYATVQQRSFEEAVKLCLDLPPREVLDFRDGLDHMEMAGCAMLDQVKKVWFYHKEDFDYQLLNEEYLTYLKALYHLTLITQRYHQHPTEEVLEANFKKLDTRYPNSKFRKEDALNRDTQAEYQAMSDVSETEDGC